MKNILLDFKAYLYPVMVSACTLLFYNCSTDSSSESSISDLPESKPEADCLITRAEGFDLIEFRGFKLLQIFGAGGKSSDTLSYILKETDAIIPERFAEIDQIEIPVERIALLHSSYVSFFDFCDVEDHIKAVSEAKYVYDSSVYHAVQSGDLPEIGYGETLNAEKLLELNIQLVITVGFPNVPNRSKQILEELGIPVLVFSDWQEHTLLGRAEWVKIAAALTDSDELCALKFSRSVQEYDRLTALAKQVADRPKVICNLPYKGTWYVPGGDSYMSHVLDDSGADYAWSGEQGTGGVQIDFEVAYASGMHADYWLNTDFVNSIGEITDKDPRMADFAPIKNGMVYNNNNRVLRGTTSDYWESGIVRPEVILADMIKIFHPELLPEHELYFYKQIR